MKIDKFGLYNNIYDSAGKTDQLVYMGFSEFQESSYIENIISHTKDPLTKNIIANVELEDHYLSKENEYLKIIIEDFIKMVSVKPLVEMIDIGFDYRAYIGDSYINMDYILYREYDENISNFDFFAIRTNITTSSACSKIEVRHDLPNKNTDQIIDYGPGSLFRPSNISVGLSFGESGPSGSIGWSFNVGGGPTIDTSYSSIEEFVNWEIKKYWFFGEDLGNQMFALGSSWASLTANQSAKIDITYRAQFEFGNNVFRTSWKTVNIVFDYCGPNHSNFRYTYSNFNQHEKICMGCGYVELESHKFIVIPSRELYCPKCDYYSGIFLE